MILKIIGILLTVLWPFFTPVLLFPLDNRLRVILLQKDRLCSILIIIGKIMAELWLFNHLWRSPSETLPRSL